MAYRKTRTVTADEQTKRDERRARFRELARAGSAEPGEGPAFIMVTVFDVSQTDDAQQQQAPERIQLEAPRYQPAAAEGE